MTSKKEKSLFGIGKSSQDPVSLFADWMARAETSEPSDANACALATSDTDGMPNVRMVLLKAFDDDGFVFYTNFESAKGRELLANPQAALVFHWKSQQRQVRLRGAISPVSAAQADAYYDSRSRDSRIGAWASKQSRSLESRFALEKQVAKFAAKYAIGKVPRPPHWSGFRLSPVEFEFWRNGTFRLHDRLVFRRASADDNWSTTRLYP